MSADAWMEAIGPFSRRDFAPARLAQPTALLVVDMQKYFIDRQGDAFLPLGRMALPRVQTLIEAFRDAARPVVFTRHEDRAGDAQGAMGRWWGSIMEPGDPQLDLVPEVAPRAGELVIHKNKYSAFHDTELRAYLNDNALRGVVICGVMTHLCCETTARDAFMDDLDVTLAVDAMGSSSEELHLAALKTLVNGFAVAAPVREICDALAASAGRDRATPPGTGKMK